MAQPQPKSKTDQAIAVGIDVAKWVRTTGIWVIGIMLTVLLFGTVAAAFDLTSQFIPTMDPMPLAYVGVAYWAIASR